MLKQNHPKPIFKEVLTVHSFSSSDPVFTLSKSSPPQFRTCLRLPSLRSVSGAGPERLGSSRKLRVGLSPSCCETERLCSAQASSSLILNDFKKAKQTKILRRRTTRFKCETKAETVSFITLDLMGNLCYSNLRG